MNATQTINGECPKCLGSGRVPFRHIEGGVCFQCRGTGRIVGRTNVPASSAAPVEPKLTKEEALQRIENILTNLVGTNGWETLGVVCDRHDEAYGTGNHRDEVVKPVIDSILRAISATR